MKFPFMFVPVDADVVGETAGFMVQSSDKTMSPHVCVGFTLHGPRLSSELQCAIGDDMNLCTMNVHEDIIFDWARMKMVVALEEFVLK